MPLVYLNGCFPSPTVLETAQAISLLAFQKFFGFQQPHSEQNLKSGRGRDSWCFSVHVRYLVLNVSLHLAGCHVLSEAVTCPYWKLSSKLRSRHC